MWNKTDHQLSKNVHATKSMQWKARFKSMFRTKRLKQIASLPTWSVELRSDRTSSRFCCGESTYIAPSNCGQVFKQNTKHSRAPHFIMYLKEHKSVKNTDSGTEKNTAIRVANITVASISWSGTKNVHFLQCLCFMLVRIHLKTRTRQKTRDQEDW